MANFPFSIILQLMTVELMINVCPAPSGAVITDIRSEAYLDNNTRGLVELKFDGAWYPVCHHGDRMTWGKREANVACRQLGSEGGWPLQRQIINVTSSNWILYNFDCSGFESNLNQCGFEMTEKCMDSQYAGIRCYHKYKVELVGGLAPNAGRVQVKYDDEWSSVCFESESSMTRQWSFSNVQVVCRELGFPGAMLARQGEMGEGLKPVQSVIDGYKCKGDFSQNSLKECLPDLPANVSTEDSNLCGNGSQGIGNEAIAVCAVPGYLGCFEINENINMTRKTRQSSNMTINMCRDHCRIQNFTQACMHEGNTCFCADSALQNHVPDSNCRERCSGDENQVCGDKQAISVYNVNKGLCDAPLNKSGIYYYGDIIDGFIYDDTGMDLPCPASLQCLMGNSSDKMVWIDINSKSERAPGQWTTSSPIATDEKIDSSSRFIPGGIIGGTLGCFVVIIFAAVMIACYSRKNAQDANRKEEPLQEETKMTDIQPTNKQTQGASTEEQAPLVKKKSGTNSGKFPDNRPSADGENTQPTKASDITGSGPYVQLADFQC